MSNSKFVLTFASLLMFFVALTFGIYFLAGQMSSDVKGKLSDAAQEIMKEHTYEVTKPVASFALGDPSSMQVAEIASGPVDIGEKIYKNACTSCHAAGVGGAPITGDKDAWAARIGKGLDTLYASVINGLGIMPPKGGSSASDEDIKLAVNYLVRQADPSAAPAPESAKMEATDEIPQPEEIILNESDSMVEEVAVVQEAASSVDLAAGEELYNTACVACHAAGVAGAPIMGDKAAWTERVAKGVDTLYGSVINGLGVMPPRGGSNADDATVKSAVDYMISQSQ